VRRLWDDDGEAGLGLGHACCVWFLDGFVVCIYRFFYKVRGSPGPAARALKLQSDSRVRAIPFYISVIENTQNKTHRPPREDMPDAQERVRKKPRLAQTALMKNMTGLAALHVHLMRISHAQNAYDVLCLDVHTAYFPYPIDCRKKQLLHFLCPSNLDDLGVTVDVIECGLGSCVLAAAERVLWAADKLIAKWQRFCDVLCIDSDSDHEQTNTVFIAYKPSDSLFITQLY